MWPTRSQWRRWSLPSRLTLIGTVAGIISILLTLVLSRWPLAPAPVLSEAVNESPDVLPSEVARRAIVEMVHSFPDIPPPRVLSVTTPVNRVAAVAVQPPYREFPNVILFRYDDGAKRWRRVFEGLTIGIQFEQSSIIDLHTLGEAVDVAQPKNESQQQYLSRLGFGAGFVPVMYEKFIHLHPSGRESYYLDKRDFGRLAKQVIPAASGRFHDTDCTLFDVPELYSVSLSHNSGRFELDAQTINSQQWAVTFTGIAGDGRLDDKLIVVEHLKQSVH